MPTFTFVCFPPGDYSGNFEGVFFLLFWEKNVTTKQFYIIVIKANSNKKPVQDVKIGFGTTKGLPTVSRVSHFGNCDDAITDCILDT